MLFSYEREIARVRGGIEQMEAQRKHLETRVAFSTVELEVREERRESLGLGPSPIGTQLWNALVGGVRTAGESIVAFARVALEYGPVLLVWSMILFLPARFAWRRLRPALRSPDSA